MRCDECEERDALWRCSDCGQGLCDSCDSALHLKGRRRAHQRERRSDCQGDSAPNTRTAPVQSSTAVLYWDLSGCPQDFLPDSQTFLTALLPVCSSPPEIILYAQSTLRLTPEHVKSGFRIAVPRGLTVYESIIMDISLKIRTDKPNVLVLLSCSESAYKSFLRELRSTAEGVSVYFSSGQLPLSFKPIPSPQSSSPHSETFHDGIPLLHYWSTRGFSSINSQLREVLIEFANSGRSRVELSSLIAALQRAALVKSPQARDIITTYELAGAIHSSSVSFGSGKTASFVGIKANCPSMQLMFWAAKSLQRDEITPTERAVQMRLLDAFRCKPSQETWEKIMTEVDNFEKSSKTGTALGPSLTLPQLFTRPGIDPRSGKLTKLLYIAGEIWTPMDVPMTPSDIVATTSTLDWTAFCQFITDLFTTGKEDAIARGIYGGAVNFALFLALFGPDSIKGLSASRLLRLVQIAITDGLLVYESGYLTLRQGQGTTFSSLERVSQARKAIADLLRETKEGVNLEELQGWLREKVGFLWEEEEMGLEKVRDLLAGTTEVKAECGKGGETVLRAASHSPTVSTSESDGQSLLTPATAIVSEHPYSTPISRMESLHSSRLDTISRKWSGASFDLLDYYEPHLKLKAEIEGRRELHGYSRSAGTRRGGVCDEFMGLYSTFEGSEGHLETLSEEDSSSHEDKPLQSQFDSESEEEFD